jgi:large subunit ribosomal protein L10
MPTPEKAATIKELTTLLRESELAVVADYRGLTVAALSQLRRSLRGKAELHIAKNTLLIRAAEDAAVPQLSQLLEGPTAVAFAREDISGTIKILNDFARTSRVLTVRGALFGPSIVLGDKVADLANVPTRPALYGQLVGSVLGPLNNLVGSLNQLYAQVVYALQSFADKQGEGAAPASEATAEAAPTAEAAAPAAADAPAEAPSEVAPAAEAAATAEAPADASPIA